MILTGRGIMDAIEDGTIVIEDFHTDNLNPNSYNLSLSNEFVVYDEVNLDAAKPNRFTRFRIPEEGFVLEPNKLYLARTEQYTETHCYVPKIDGRSSLGRLGVFVHVTAGFGDIGYCGCWTLELAAVQPVRIYPGMNCCQISYHTTHGVIVDKYEGKYQGAKEVQPCSLWKELSSTQQMEPKE